MSDLGQKQPPTQASALWRQDPRLLRGGIEGAGRSEEDPPRGLPAGLSSSPSPLLRTPTPVKSRQNPVHPWPRLPGWVISPNHTREPNL